MEEKRLLYAPKGVYEITKTSPSKNFHRLHRKLRFSGQMEIGFKTTWWYLGENGELSEDLKYGICRTSTIIKIEVNDDLSVVKLTTRNSEYKFERVSE
jgi:hypothetical protein